MEKPKYQCRFGLFVKLKPGVLSHYPDQKRTWYYNGNKFTDEEPKMLRNLLSHIKTNMHRYEIVEVYDNNFPTDADDRIIFKQTDTIVAGGKVIRTRLKNNIVQAPYNAFLAGYSLKFD